MCPYSAFMKFRQVSTVKENKMLPVFRTTQKMCLTGKEMNGKLTLLTEGITKDNPGSYFKMHSFRAGVCSEMAKQGRKSEDCMAVGRWTSSFFTLYLSR